MKILHVVITPGVLSWFDDSPLRTSDGLRASTVCGISSCRPLNATWADLSKIGWHAAWPFRQSNWHPCLKCLTDDVKRLVLYSYVLYHA